MKDIAPQTILGEGRSIWQRVVRVAARATKVGAAIVLVVLLATVKELESQLDPWKTGWREGFGTSLEHMAANDVTAECLGGVIENCAEGISHRLGLSIVWLDSKELRRRSARDITPYYLGVFYGPAGGRAAGHPAVIVLAGVTGVDRAGKMREWRVQVITYDARPQDWDQSLGVVASDMAETRIYAACGSHWEGTTRCLRWERVFGGRTGFYELLPEWGIELEKGAAERVRGGGLIPSDVGDRLIPLDKALLVVRAAKYT